jgi:Putative bacterial sensory transduction regulator
MRTLTAVNIFLYFLLTVTSASAEPAQSPIVKTVTAEQVSAALKEAGYKVEFDKYSDGDTYLRVEMVNWYVIVDFAGCTPQHNCGGVRFYTLFPKNAAYNLDLANTINNVKFATKASIDAEGNLMIQLASYIGGGVTLENIKQIANFFQGELKSLTK